MLPEMRTAGRHNGFGKGCLTRLARPGQSHDGKAAQQGAYVLFTISRYHVGTLLFLYNLSKAFTNCITWDGSAVVLYRQDCMGVKSYSVQAASVSKEM